MMIEHGIPIERNLKTNATVYRLSDYGRRVQGCLQDIVITTRGKERLAKGLLCATCPIIRNTVQLSRVGGWCQNVACSQNIYFNSSEKSAASEVSGV